MNITAIGAHPDDLEIFAYGFLAVAAARGDRLTLGIATDGAAGGTEPGPALAAKRAVEARDGLAGLGVPVGLDLPDGKGWRVPDARTRITDFIAAARLIW